MSSLPSTGGSPMNKVQEFKRGWQVLVAAGLGAAVGVSPLIQFTLGPFMEPLSREFGWTRAQISAAGLGKSVGLLLVSVFVGALADRYGARRVALASQFMLALGFLAMAFLPGNLWLFYLGYVLLILCGAGTLQMIWARAVVGWFTAGRGLALGVSLMTVGLLGGLTPSYVTYLIAHYGWRGGYVGIAALPLLVGLPIAYFWFREPPTGPSEEVLPIEQSAAAEGWTLGQAMRTLAFWQLSLFYFLGAIGVFGALTHAVPMLTDRGLDRGASAALLGLFGVSVGLGRLITGQLLDTFNPERLVATLFLLPAAGCLLLLFAAGNAPLCGLALCLLGFAGGVEGDSGAYLVARYFGRAHFGAIYGLLIALTILGGGVGPFLVGYSFDTTGSYDVSLMLGIGTFLSASVLVYFLRWGSVRPGSATPAH